MKRVRLKDVAAKAGVSVCTASRVLNDKKVKISEETRTRVLAVARGLGYRPDVMARGLKTRRTYLCGLVVQSVATTFFADIIQGVQDMAEAHGYNVLLYTTMDDFSKEVRYLGILDEKGVDGLIICPTSPTSIEVLNKFHARGMAVVGILNMVSEASFPQIAVDNLKGGFLATEHLVKLGHRRIAHLSAAAVEFNQGKDRLRGYREALLGYGLEFDDTLVIETSYDWKQGYLAARKLLAMKDPPTAVFACSDMSAWGAMRAFKEAGVSVPEDIAVVGYDDISIASLIEVPLTTIVQPKYEIGQMSMALLLDAISGKPVGDRVITPHLVVRRSCGAPNADMEGVKASELMMLQVQS